MPEIFENCRHYLGRDLTIALPCAIGSDIYYLVTKKYRPDRESFTMIRKSALTYGNLERVMKDLGDTVFLTREEADRAMMEKELL